MIAIPLGLSGRPSGKSRHANIHGDDERFSGFVAARRQTAANFPAHFQMAALYRDAATPIPAPGESGGERAAVQTLCAV
jgi:hypothetical protein